MGVEPDTIRLDLPASHAYLGVLGACIAELLTHIDGVEDAVNLSHTVQLAIHEACTNIVDHAYAGRPPGRIQIAITIHPSPRRLVAELTDTGASFDPTLIPEPDLLEGQERGYGLYLMRQILDDVAYEAQPSGNRWQLTKYL